MDPSFPLGPPCLVSLSSALLLTLPLLQLLSASGPRWPSSACVASWGRCRRIESSLLKTPMRWMRRSACVCFLLASSQRRDSGTSLSEHRVEGLLVGELMGRFCLGVGIGVGGVCRCVWWWGSGGGVGV